MGGGGAGSSGAKEAAQAQAQIVRDLFAQTEKSRGTGISNILNVLQTGGRGSGMPAITREATSAVDLAKDRTIANVVAAGNKTGAGGTPFLKGVTGQLSQSGGALREAARGALNVDMLSRAPEVSVSGVQLATQGLQGLVRRGAAEQTAKSQRDTQIATAGASVGGAVAAAVVAYLI